VIASFPVGKLPHAVSRDELAAFTYLRQAFITAGAARVLELVDPERWVQVGASFAGARRADAFMRERVLPRVEAWLQAGRVSRFFYMWKPPGVRLRFCVPRPTAGFERELTALLSGARRARLITRHEYGLYDAETYQFGGEAGIDLYHRHATIDSIAVLRLKDLLHRGRAEADASSLSLVLLSSVFSQVTGDAWELWDVWSNMRLTGRSFELTAEQRAIAREQMKQNQVVLRRAVLAPDAFVAGLSKEERQIVADYRRGHAKWAAGVKQAIRRRQLLFGIRKVLPFYAIFHWNRFGFPGYLQSTLTYFMQELLSPKGTRRP
jgi:thiopeptide-type bacteriocin biosynthesis protein